MNTNRSNDAFQRRSFSTFRERTWPIRVRETYMKRMYIERKKEKRKTGGNSDPQRVRLERLKDICVSESRSGVVGTDVRNGRNIIGSDVNLPNYNAKSRRGNHERKPRLINSGKGARQMASICTTKFLSRGKKSASQHEIARVHTVGRMHAPLVSL